MDPHLLAKAEHRLQTHSFEKKADALSDISVGLNSVASSLTVVPLVREQNFVQLKCVNFDCGGMFFPLEGQRTQQCPRCEAANTIPAMVVFLGEILEKRQPEFVPDALLAIESVPKVSPTGDVEVSLKATVDVLEENFFGDGKAVDTMQKGGLSKMVDEPLSFPLQDCPELSNGDVNEDFILALRLQNEASIGEWGEKNSISSTGQDDEVEKLYIF
jgi:hypothetical protein